jgi:trans-aconitate methyltransferase
MFFLYITVAVLGTFVCVFFLTRSLITLVSFFSKSPFVPLEKVLIDKGLNHLNMKKEDRFLDIGCGDGRVVFSCAKKYPGATFYKGIEIIPVLVYTAKLKRFLIKKVEEREKISFERKDARKYTYSEFNKIFMYLLPEFVSELMPKLEKELPSEAVVVSVAFKIPEIYKRSGELKVEEVKFGRKKKKIYIWKKK